MLFEKSLLSPVRIALVSVSALAVLAAPARSVAQAGAPGVITLQALVDQMLNPDSLAEFHAYANTSGVEDSKDPRARTQYFFSDTDGGNYQRDMIGASGHTEHVMIDVTGPGALTRFFLAGPQAMGTIRIYLDGNTTPVFTGDLDALMEGTGGFAQNSPLRYAAGPTTISVPGSGPNGETREVPPGLDLYMPIPFANHALVTYDGPSNTSPNPYPVMDYIWEYTRFLPGTGVVSWDPSQVQSLHFNGQFSPVKVQQEGGQGDLSSVAAYTDSNAKRYVHRAIPAGQSVSVTIPASGAGSAIRLLQAKLGTPGNSSQDSNLQNINLAVSFDDDVNAINEPIGSFYGSGEGLHPGTTQMQSVGSDGTMTSRWTMPFQKTATIVLTNNGDHPIHVDLDANVGDYAWGAYTMHFHAIRRINGPMYIPHLAQTMRMMDITGTGVLVGDSETVINAQPAGDYHFNWWGEGDELMYVDRAQFPTHRGTGSEDYYGYAYGHTYLFQSPWTSQTSVPPQTAPGQFDYDGGQTVLNRVRLLDTVPFNSSFRYDFEIHENSDPQAQILVDHTSFFYVLPSVNTQNNAFVPFSVISDGVQDGQLYSIESKVNGWLLTANPNTDVVTDIPTQTGPQQFRLHLLHDNVYTLENVGTGMYLGSSCCGLGAALNLAPLNGPQGSCDQQWTITNFYDTGTNLPGSGFNDYQTLVNGCGLAADVRGADTKAGTTVQEYTSNGNDAQQWRFNVSPVGSDPIIPNGVYEIRNTLSPNLAIDVPYASTDPSKPLQVYYSNGSNAQLWTINYIGNGVYSILDVNSNLALDNAGGGDGARAVQYPYTTGQNQQWRFIQQGTSNNFFIQNVANGEYLSMGGNQGPGSPLIQADKDQIPWQAWFFQPVVYP